MKAKFFLALVLFLTAAIIPLSAQEEEPADNVTVAPATAEDADAVYVIREVEFDIDGRSRPFALITNGEFKAGERIHGKENLDKYLALKTQLLLNQRVLEDASIEYSLGEAEEDGALPVKLLVHVKDSFNVVVLPYPKYDSNDGFTITIKARDYNFLGTMSPLRLDVGYNQNGSDKTFNLSLDTNIPFQASGLNWNFNFGNYFSYTLGKPLYYQNVTGLSLNLPWQATTFTVGFNQYLTVNEQNTDTNKDLYHLGDYFDGPYASTELFTYWSIPFGIEVGDFGQITYTPGISEKINYPYGKMDEPHKPVTTISHTLGFGRVNWIGNYRKGLTASVSNAYSWYFDRTDAPMQITLDAGASFYWPFSKYFGFSTRLRYRQWWQWSDTIDEWIPYYYAGDVLRGVIDDHLRADNMLSLNLDFPIRILRFWPSEWFNNSKLRLFNFEMHFSPFIDVALLNGPYNKLKADPWEGTKFSRSDMIYTGGLEVIVFPGFFRSFYLRGSIGYNIEKIRKNGLSKKWGFFPQWDEIFIGVDHYY